MSAVDRKDESSRARGTLFVAALIAASLAVPRIGHAQLVSPGATPVYGTASLYGGSTALSGVSGGPVRLSSVDSGCRGSGTYAPSHILTTNGGTVRITGAASGDTTLMVMGPDGRIYCDDDGGGYPNPQVDLSAPAGPIAIWVGSYSAGSSHPYTLTVTSSGGGGYASAGGAMFGTASFPGGRDPVMLSGTYGGPVDADTMGSCPGYISAAPSHIINVTSYVPNLRFVVNGDGDTTLVVQYADGHVACNDDGGGYPHPLVEGPAAPGSVRVWVGSYGSGRSGSYMLGVTANPSVTASTLGSGGVSPPVVVTPPPTPPPTVTPPVVTGPPASATRVDLTARIPVTLFGSGVSPTVAVWSPRGGPDVEISAMPSGSVVGVSASVGGTTSPVVEVPAAIASGATVLVTELRNHRLVVRAESPTGGSAMVWLLDYRRGSVEVRNTWTGSLSDRSPGWSR